MSAMNKLSFLQIIWNIDLAIIVTLKLGKNLSIWFLKMANNFLSASEEICIMLFRHVSEMY